MRPEGVTAGDLGSKCLGFSASSHVGSWCHPGVSAHSVAVLGWRGSCGVFPLIRSLLGSPVKQTHEAALEDFPSH